MLHMIAGKSNELFFFFFFFAFHVEVKEGITDVYFVNW